MTYRLGIMQTSRYRRLVTELEDSGRMRKYLSEGRWLLIEPINFDYCFTKFEDFYKLDFIMENTPYKFALGWVHNDVIQTPNIGDSLLYFLDCVRFFLQRLKSFSVN